MTADRGSGWARQETKVLAHAKATHPLWRKGEERKAREGKEKGQPAKTEEGGQGENVKT